ncbi:hypothetical protein GCM10023197_22540 [Gordonia humi]
MDADGLIDHTARRAALVADAAECAALLAGSGFGAWWRDGRPTGLEPRLTDLSARLERAVSGLDGATGDVRRQSAVLTAADAEASTRLIGLRR